MENKEIVIEPIKSKEVVKKVKHHEINFPDGAHGAVVTENEIIIFGRPSSDDYDENLAHNCDQMGCGFDHILLRISANASEWFADEERKIKVVYE